MFDVLSLLLHPDDELEPELFLSSSSSLSSSSPKIAPSKTTKNTAINAIPIVFIHACLFASLSAASASNSALVLIGFGAGPVSTLSSVETSAFFSSVVLLAVISPTSEFKTSIV